MVKEPLLIGNIPAMMWGPVADKLMIAVHGKDSSKSDFDLVAEVVVEKGYQVLSFDLPEHGDRKEEQRLCDAQNCVEDLAQVMQYARTLSDHISVFGCSIGAYFSILAYQDEPIQKALFLSPIVDMRRLIENMMKWFDVSEERLRKEQEVPTPINTLYWHYYQYVLENPVKWDKPTALLYGSKDELCEYETISTFAKRWGASLTVLEGGEHFFHTDRQLTFLKKWLCDTLET